MAQRSHRITPQFYDPSFTPPDEGTPRQVFNAKSFDGGKDPGNGNFSDWSLEVPGKGRARPPVAVDFIGTVSQEKPDPFASPAENRRRAAEIQKEADRNGAVLEKAIFILSQSPTGRAVLEEMTREGYRIVFDDRRTGERGAGGLCDPGDKMIILRAHDNPEYLALLLGHESVHAVQNTRHDLFPSTRHRPEVGIKLSFAIEADAYAQQAQIALELSYGDPLGPQDQIRFAGPVKQMRERFPDIVAAAEKVIQTEDALQNGATCAVAFQAFYNNFYLRTFYEDSHMEWATMYAPKIQGSSFAWLQKPFTKDVDSDWIKERIQHKGIPYLKVHAPHLNFDDARYAGLTEETNKKVRKFYKDFLPKEKLPALKLFGVHMKDAVMWVLGLTTTTHMVIKNDDDKTKPPLRTPPRRKWGGWK